MFIRANYVKICLRFIFYFYCYINFSDGLSSVTFVYELLMNAVLVQSSYVYRRMYCSSFIKKQ